MSKSTDNILLVPGESGWEIWSGTEEGGYTLQSATETPRAADLAEIPHGELTMFFPAKSITALPMRVTSDDDAIFPDLAALHAERLGLRPDPMAGQLTDVFLIRREAENSAILSVFLRAPADGELPRRGPKGFDISARAFPVTGNTLALWKEFGRWVFAIYDQGALVFCQATSVDSYHPDEALVREIRLSMIQLSMQGIDTEPSLILAWSSATELNCQALRDSFHARVEATPRPAPVPPSPLSKLLPADVRAARRAALRRRNIRLGVTAVAAIYLGIIGWFSYGLWKDMQLTQQLRADAVNAAPDAEAFALHVAKWDELAPVVELANSPVDILYRIATCIPPNSGLRLKTAEISANEIKLIGEAPALQAANTFSLNLSKNNELAKFTWQTPEPSQSSRGWEFVFSGEIPTTQP